MRVVSWRQLQGSSRIACCEAEWLRRGRPLRTVDSFEPIGCLLPAVVKNVLKVALKYYE